MLEFFVRRPIGTTMIYGAVLLLGAISLSRLKVSLFPDVQIPQLTILTPYASVSPEEIENLVSRPVEDAVSSVNGVKRMTSRSQEGLSIVEVALDWGSSLDLAMVNVRQKVDLAKSVLPQDAEKPIIVKFDPASDPVITLVARPSGLDQARLRDYVDRNVRPFLERIEGVASISIVGGVRREIHVNVDSEKLFAYGLSLDHIARALDASNFNFPAGSVRRGDKELTIRVQGEFQSVDEIGRTVISTGDSGAPVFLHQVAQIEDAYRDRTGSALHNRKSAVIIEVKKEPNKNTIDTARNIRSALTEINRKFEKHLTLEIIQDRSRYVSDAIANVRSEAAIGGCVAILALFIFLKDVWPSLIIAVTLPISIITTFVFMFLKGLSLNVMSLGGLALGIGMLLDSAIVVMESITLEREQNPLAGSIETAVSGTRKVIGSVVSAAGTTIVVFVPIIFVPGIAGEVFRDFAFTITFSLLSALICSLSLVPMLFALPIRPGSLIFRAFSCINDTAKPLFDQGQKLMDLVSAAYTKSIDFSLRRPRTILFWSFGAGAAGIVILFLLPRSLFPDVDQGIVQAEMELPGGSTIEDSEAIHAKIHEFLESNHLATAVTTIGYDEDDLASRVRGIRKGNHSESHYYIDRSKMSSREFTEVLSQGLAGFANLKASYRIKGEALQELLGETSPTLIAQIEHPRREEAREAARLIEKESAGKRGVVAVRNSALAQDPEITIRVDRQKIASHGLSVESVARTIRTAVNGTIATVYREGDQEIDVRLRLRPADRRTIDQTHRLLINLPREGTIQIGQLIHPVSGLGYPTIIRENQKRIEQVKVEYDKANRSEVEEVLNAARAHAEQQFAAHAVEDRPLIRIKEGNEETMESLGGLLGAFAISAVLIYMLLAGQFESFLHPFTLALIIPLMLFGVSTALLFTGHGLNISSAIGMILLAGIVVDAATVLYEYIEQTRGADSIDASDIDRLPEILKHCGRARIRAILLTGLTNMLGSLPSAGTAASGDLQAPMAVTIVGGMAMATVLTLIAFPTMFLVMERFRHQLRTQGLIAVFARRSQPGMPDAETAA